ncbi:hypothetical protein [Undibacterium sp. WLHG33]|uniref:hypothetical protein n=1 Tax=Undibacterium sp. WLHG33 TaxID=3412482 RepID=UPI003C2EB376
MNIYQVNTVFTPSTPARIAFVERKSINDKLVNALTTLGKQIVVYGHSGSGKTTLLVNKLNQVYESHITTRCMKGMKFEQIILDAFDQLATFFTSERTGAQKKTISAEISASYLALQSKVQANEVTEAGTKELRMVPPQLTGQALGRFIGASKSCWVLEDFHKIEESEKSKLSQLMKIFMDLADEYNDLKIIALGAVDTARQVVDYDPEMRNRVAEVRVDLMSESEIMDIIAKGEQVLNLIIPLKIKNLIARYSNGLASVCHHLCLYMCHAEGIHETCKTPFTMTKVSFETALKMYAEEASDSIRSTFDKALKVRRKSAFNNQEIILRALSTFKERGASRIEIYKKIQETTPSFPEKNTSNCLPKLLTQEYGEILRFDSNSGLYSFSDPIFRAFALVYFREELPPNGNLSEIMKQLTMELKKHFPRENVRVAIHKVSK